MHVIDLVLQGVRRFGESRKFPAKPGFNVVFGPQDSGKTTLVDCLLDLLFPSQLRDTASLVSNGNPAASRAGLTLSSGRDIYRVLKDFKTGKLSLTQYNPASQKFEPLAADPAQAASLLATAFDLPAYSIYYHLFLAAGHRMPSLADGLGEDPAQAATMMGVPPGMISAGGLPAMSAPGMPAPGMVPGMVPGMSAPGMLPGMFSTPGMPGMMPGMAMPGMMPGMGMPGMMQGMGMAPGMGMPGMMPGLGGMMPAGMMPGMAPVPPVQDDDGMTPAEREDKLRSLREELKQAEKVNEIQFEVDGLQQKLFDIDKERKKASQFDKFIDTAKEQLDRYPTLRRIPDNIESRLDNFKNLDAQRANEIEKFDNQAIDYDEELANIRLTPKLWNQGLFRLGAGLFVGGLVGFIAAPIVGLASLKMVFGAASIPGIFVSAYVIWMHIARMTRQGALEKILADIEEKKQQSIKRYEVEMAVIEKLMEDTESDAIDELKNKVQKYRDLDERYKSVMDRKKKLLKEIDVEKMAREEKDLKDKIKHLEEELRKFPAISMDVTAMRKEITRLENLVRLQNPNSASLKAPEGFAIPDLGGPVAAPAMPVVTAAAPPVAMPGSGPGATVVAQPARRGPTAPELYDLLIQAASALFGSERNALVASVQPRFNQYVQAFFGKKYNEGRIDPDGCIALRQADGHWLDFDKLSPPMRDTCYVALQIALLEQATQKRLLPIILDDPFCHMDEAAAILAAKAMKRLSERTQVILLTTSNGPVQLAENSLSLA